MASPPSSTTPKSSKSRWYAPTLAKFLFAVLVMQGVLFLSAHYRWFWFNERKGYTVLITVAATACGLLLLVVAAVMSRLFKSKLQFGLLTLLAVILVVAIPLAWFVRELDLARKVGEARTSVGVHEFFDGAWGVGQAKSKRTRTLRPLLDYDAIEDHLRPRLGEYFFREPKVLILTGPEFLPLIRNMTQLETFQCILDEKAKGMEIDLADLRGLHRLQQLNIKGCLIVGSGLEPLSLHSSLRNLVLSGTNVTDQDLATLTRMKQLKRLGLSNTQLTDAGLMPIRELESLEHLWLVQTAVTDVGLEHIRELDQLRKLNLRATHITDAGLEHLKGLTQLEWVSLKETDVSDVGIKALAASLPNCQIEY